MAGPLDDLGIDKDSLSKENISLDVAEEALRVIATHRGELLGKKGPDTSDLRVAAWLLCLSPNWPKPTSYRRYARETLRRGLARTKNIDEIDNWAASVFPKRLLVADPNTISKWLYAHAERPQDFRTFDGL